MKKNEAVVICLLDENPSALRIKDDVLSSADWQIRPFTRPDAFLEYAGKYHPHAAVIDLGGASADGLSVAAQLRELSPRTSVIMSTKTHHDNAARDLLESNELLNLIEQQCIKTRGVPSFEQRSFAANGKDDFACCA
jgi:DNA-binding NtrC family response regulator